MNFDNKKFYRAKLALTQLSETRETAIVEVVSTTNHSTSSYGHKVWVDKDGNSYGEIISENPFFSVVEAKEISEDDAENFFAENDENNIKI